jgi:FkbM family methyltransferase
VRHGLLSRIRHLLTRIAARLPFFDRERTEVTRYQDQTLYYPAQSMIGAYVASGDGWDSVLQPILVMLFPFQAPSVVEVGSNIGASLMQIKLAQPDAVVHCFEPVDRFRELLEKNIAVNRWNNIHVSSAVLASTAEERHLHANTSTASVVSRDYDSHQFLSSRRVRTSTLDEIFREGSQLDFIKVDTDGFDFDVLLGGRHTLQRFHPVLFFEFEPSLILEVGRTPEDFLKYLNALTYETFLMFSNLGISLGVTHDHAKILELVREYDYLDILALPNGHQGLDLLDQLTDEIGDNYALGGGGIPKANALDS